ncbi:hypothetical protein [Amycolatopsis sp. cg9]|uniref:hypothetical protein n=1 Tax=Amycolatopsis sp. cg9 TaxID=3238801 RepID=UPI0035238C32
MTMALDLTRGDALLAAGRDADRFHTLLHTLDRDGRVPQVLASWTYINANYCTDNPAAASLTIVATRPELGPKVQHALAGFGRAGTPTARAKWWAQISPDVELALSVAMTAAVTITDRLPRLPGRAIQALEQLCSVFTGGDTAASMAAARIVVGAATDWQPPLRLGLNHAVVDGAAGIVARCLLKLAAAAVDAGTVPKETTARAGHDLDTATEPAQRAQIIAVRAAIAEAAGDGADAVDALLADIDDTELAPLLTSWGEIASTALIRTPR